MYHDSVGNIYMSIITERKHYMAEITALSTTLVLFTGGVHIYYHYQTHHHTHQLAFILGLIS